MYWLVSPGTIDNGTGPLPQPSRKPPALIPRCDDTILRARGGPDGLIVARPRPLPPGHRVRVTDGPLAGLVGIIENPPDARGRVSVLMDLLRTQTRVSLDVDDLEDA